jgi:hypothetical protein
MQGRAERRLTALAAPLQPERPPYYVRLPPPGLRATFPAPGWYWCPHGHPIAVYLGCSFDRAAFVLYQLLEDQEAA